MKRAPRDKGPIRPMPKSGDEKDDKRVANLLYGATPTAAQRDIEIIAKPCRERNMPTPPKFGNVACEIRVRKVAHERNPEKASAPNRDIAVAREVSIDLEGEANHACPK